MSSKAIGVVLALAAVVAAGAGAYWYSVRGDKPIADLNAASLKIAVRTVEVGTGTAVDQLTAVGSLYPPSKIDVTPFTSGHIQALPATEGARVKVGDALLVLESETEQVALADAEAQLKLEQERLKRSQDLTRRGVAARADLDTAQAAVAAAEATLARAQVDFDHRTIKAPFPGQIGRFEYSVGAYVSPGEVVMTLESVDLMYVDFHVPENVIEQLQTGAVFSATIDGVKGKYDGVVSFIEPVIDEATRSVELRGEIPNDKRVLRTGMFARLTLTLGQRQGAILIPDDTLVPELSGEYVYVVEGGVAKRRAVEIGTRTDGMLEVVSGLKQGESVITDGRFQVRDGMSVTVVTGAPASSG
jgi:membrane fusion protein (multidrug efflux system)